MIVYIAGKFRAPTPWLVEQNIRRAEEMSHKLWKAMVPNIAPHLLGRFLDKEIPDEVVLVGMLEIMSACDGVLVLPDHKLSSGTTREIQVAIENGQPVFFVGDKSSEGHFNQWYGKKVFDGEGE